MESIGILRLLIILAAGLFLIGVPLLVILLVVFRTSSRESPERALVEHLQAENSRLKQELEELRKGNA